MSLESVAARGGSPALLPEESAEPPGATASAGQVDMAGAPAVLEEHRGTAAQKATGIRRHLAEVEAQQAALQQRQAELEKFILAAPSMTWEEAADKARYLITLFADTQAGRDPRRQKIIAGVLDDFRRLSREPAVPDAPA